MSGNTKRIAKNTMALYAQMLMSMLIALVTSRVLLKILGVEDFGVFNVVGGIVVLFGMLNNTMASATSRFLTFELGKGNLSGLKEVFGMALLIHVFAGLLLCLMVEPIGLWFLNKKMQIPIDRMDAAYWVFHCSVLGVFISMLNVPYRATIIAHERMGVFAYFSILDLILKLIIVLCLYKVKYDHLKVYSVLLVLVQLIMQFLYRRYCRKEFKEARSRVVWNRPLFNEMLSFAGWGMIGNSAFLMYTQGVNLLLNIFFGPAVNAARAIAVQVQGLVIRFIGSFQTAVRPQITKSYAINDVVYMQKLIFASSKYSFFLYIILAIPVFLETEYVLKIWLNQVPEFTVSFVRIMLLISLIECLASPLLFAIDATGKIKIYQMTIGSLMMLILPCSYLSLKLGYPPESVFIIHFIFAVLAQAARVKLASISVNFSLLKYFLEVGIRGGGVFLLSLTLPVIIFYFFDSSFLRAFFIGCASFFSVVITTFLFGMQYEEKQFFRNIITNRFTKNKRPKAFEYEEN